MKINATLPAWAILIGLLFSAPTFAQQQNPLDIALAHVRSNYQTWGLTAKDIEDMTVNDAYTDPSTGIFRVYFQQRHQGIPVFNALQNLSITKEGKVFHVGKRFVANLADKLNTTQPVFGAEAAVQQLMLQLGLPAQTLRWLSQDEKGFQVFDRTGIAAQAIQARPSFVEVGPQVRLAWDIVLAPLGTSDVWNAQVDAVTGELLGKLNWTVYCQVDGRAFHHADHDCRTDHGPRTAGPQALEILAGEKYNVWPLPIESPNHGPRTLVSDPADPTASPYGWHDTNGQPGAEHTITRGNNVHAYEDSENQNASLGNEPDGGTNLQFDFLFSPNLTPDQYMQASVTNLFYTSNVMHDFAYAYGFNETAGNFQENNYGNGGLSNDIVLAEGQDGSDVNNSKFTTQPDGSKSRMQMYLWGLGASAKLLHVLEPLSVVGEYTTILPNDNGSWGSGAFPSEIPVTGEVVIVDDNVPDLLESDACEPLVNAPDLVGKIALIDRGSCDFGLKALVAQQAGAIGVIICDIVGGTPLAAIGGGVNGPSVNIPVVMISVADGNAIRQFAGSGLKVSIVNPFGYNQLDGNLDNGIISHEYAHGISNRLTGGPSDVSCLGNPEQMGEGWSDWVSLVTSVRPNDEGTDARGIGSYALGQNPDGPGIRRFPYSTDMSINPLTLGDVAGNTEVHAVGEVWTAMLWDLYWAMVDAHGWDADFVHGMGGNNMAIRLVFEGMKNQPCSPGFIDGRDAILAADSALYNGQNQCLIWDVFARRGAGASASQGSRFDAGDQIEAFDLPCSCANAVTIKKSVTDYISAGEDIAVTIQVSNCKQATVSGVTVTDLIPDGTAFKPGSSNLPANVSGSSVTFDLGSMDYGAAITITYALTTPADQHSKQTFKNSVATTDDWLVSGSNGNNPWHVQSTYFNSPSQAWRCEDISSNGIQSLEFTSPVPVPTTRPTFRFFHRFYTEAGADGGIVEVKEAGASAWSPVGSKMLRFGYPTGIQFGTFGQNLAAFTGNSGFDFKATYVDLSEWADKEVVFRFRFGTNNNTAGPLGWVVDDIGVMELLSYNAEACVTTIEGDNTCSLPAEEGTIVAPVLVIGQAGEHSAGLGLTLAPNPASGLLNVSISSQTPQELHLGLLNLNGQTLLERQLQVSGYHQATWDVSSLPAGFYFVKISGADGSLLKKLVIN